MTSTRTLLLIILTLLVTACGSEFTPTPTPPPLPDPGLATAMGRIVNAQGKFQPRVLVRLAEVVHGIEGRGGAFILDTAHSPTIYTDESGYFILPNIKAAEYVIVVGDIEVTGIYEIIPQENGKARVFNMPADQVTDVGDIIITIQPPQLLPSLEPGTTTTPGVYPPPVSYPPPAEPTPYP